MREITFMIEDETKYITASMMVLEECIDLQRTKAADYQSAKSSVVQADHYRRGIDTIHDMIHQKMMRAQSLIESGHTPKNEALEDTYKDMINYCSFAISWLRKGIPGQKSGFDMFNRPLNQISETCNHDSGC